MKRKRSGWKIIVAENESLMRNGSTQFLRDPPVIQQVPAFVTTR
jgi:hypothetical protein